MAESELLCVRVATLRRNKYASVLRVYHMAIHVRIVKFLFIVLGMCLALITDQAKNMDIALAIILIRTS